MSEYDSPNFYQQVCKASDMDDGAVKNLLQIYFSEMRYGYEFVSSRMENRQSRILEVGAGLGLLSLFFASQGHEVVALEPPDSEFDFFETTKKVIWQQANKRASLVEKGAEDLDPETDGSFDLIFSVNVMEHIEKLHEATSAVLSVMKPGGESMNLCPNYIVPFEPHYNLLLVPFAPKLSRFLWRKQIDANPEVWDTLNFITYFDVRKMARANGATVKFETGLLHDSLTRIAQDDAFAARHGNSIVGKTFRLLKSLRLLAMTKHLPAALSSPMIFTYTKNSKA